LLFQDCRLLDASIEVIVKFLLGLSVTRPILSAILVMLGFSLPSIASQTREHEENDLVRWCVVNLNLRDLHGKVSLGRPHKPQPWRESPLGSRQSETGGHGNHTLPLFCGYQIKKEEERHSHV
jgi:hypothetical protein